jgi:hypothetical protein
VVSQNLPRIFQFFFGEFGHVLVPHRAQLNPMQPEIAGHNLARLLKILRDLVIDHRQPEWARARVRSRRARRTR